MREQASIPPPTRQGLHWTGSCHYNCGAPYFVCPAFSKKGPCRHRDILLPVLLMGFRTEPYKSILHDLTSGVTDEKA